MTMFKIRDREPSAAAVCDGISPTMWRFLREESGATAIEYAMVASGVAVAVAATVTSLGTVVKTLFTDTLTALK